jgi:hypothetical protein
MGEYYGNDTAAIENRSTPIYKRTNCIRKLVSTIFIILLDILWLPVTAADKSEISADSQKPIAELIASAEKGDVKSQYELGLKYSSGKGIQKNKIQAYMWLHLAAEQGFSQAVSARYEISSTMSQDEIAEAKRLASKFEEPKKPQLEQFEYYTLDSEGGKRIPPPPDGEGCYIYINGVWGSATMKETDSTNSPVSCRTIIGVLQKNMVIKKNY